jgi:hypothetical protein
LNAIIAFTPRCGDGARTSMEGDSANREHRPEIRARRS